jgi:putative ABC transport system permease protein
MSTLMRDVKYAVRTLVKNPGFSAVALLTIALGIGASTAIFSVANAVLLRPLPYADPSRLVVVWGDLVARHVVDFPFAPGDLPDLREQGTLFDGFAGVNTGSGYTQTPGGGDPEKLRFGQATVNLFSLLGARMAIGRDFQESDGEPQPQPPAAQQAGAAAGAAPAGAPAAAKPAPNAPNVAPAPPPVPLMAILSHGYWQRRFGGDRSIIGQEIDIAFGRRAQVVGVLTPDFELLLAPRLNVERVPDVWTAMRLDFSTASRINVFLRVIGRLKPNVTLAQAQTQADKIGLDLQSRFPIKKTAGLHLRVEPMQKDLVKDVRPAILTLLGAVLFVLLIACANVANLLLVRASGRERELAIRAAMGGSRWRLTRQLLAESLLLAIGGALLGLAIAQSGIRLLSTLQPANLPRVESIAIDPAVLAFTAVAAILSAVIFGLVPAVRASRPDVMVVLRQTGAEGLRAGRLIRGAVVMTEVALSFVLLIGAGLMLRSFVALQHAYPGYDPKGVLTFLVQLPNQRANQADQRAVMQRQLLEGLRAVPHVQSVSAATPLPLDGDLANARWGTHEALTDATKFRQADVHTVLPGYFETMHARLIVGRTFTDADNQLGGKIVIIDDHLAARAFPNENAIGKHIFARVTTNEPEEFEVVGVVGHERPTSLSEDGHEAIFLTDGYFGHGVAGRWVVRSEANPAQLGTAVRAAVAKIDPLMLVAEMQPMQVYVDQAMAATRFATTLIGIFAVIAVVLASIGLYGVLSTAVRQRTPEIGVRIAFGASRANILGLVIGQGVKLSVAGIALGLVAAFGLTHLMASLLVSVQPTDPVTFAGITALFFVIAVVASWLPARRAAALNPTVALRD